ncbi:MAG TPA: type II toxin-antitoxin system PemK/MazF family toxin [Armatimonadota bacterium]|jgi:mRNA interferase MazF
MVIRQGEVFWTDLGQPAGSEPGYRRPCIVIQNDTFNASRIGTVLICTLTTNIALASAPHNVLLEPGEGGLPKRSVVNVSQVMTVDRTQLEGRIGSLSSRRIREVIAGVHLVIDPS